MPPGQVDEQKWYYHKNTLQNVNLKCMKSQFIASLILAFSAKPLTQHHASYSAVSFPFY